MHTDRLNNQHVTPDINYVVTAMISRYPSLRDQGRVPFTSLDKLNLFLVQGLA